MTEKADWKPRIVKVASVGYVMDERDRLEHAHINHGWRAPLRRASDEYTISHGYG